MAKLSATAKRTVFAACISVVGILVYFFGGYPPPQSFADVASAVIASILAGVVISWVIFFRQSD